MRKDSLDNVTIDDFRGLRNLCPDELGLINILVGKNDSGKTSVLEALSIPCDPLDPFEWVSMVRRRDFGRMDETRVQSLRWRFPTASRPGASRKHRASASRNRGGIPCPRS